MTKRIGMAVLALMLMTGGSATIVSASSQAAAEQQQPAKAASVSARHRVRHHDRYAYRSYDRPYYPTYYDRPAYYAPAPFFPFLGIGYGPWW